MIHLAHKSRNRRIARAIHKNGSLRDCRMEKRIIETLRRRAGFGNGFFGFEQEPACDSRNAQQKNYHETHLRLSPMLDGHCNRNSSDKKKDTHNRQRQIVAAQIRQYREFLLWQTGCILAHRPGTLAPRRCNVSARARRNLRFQIVCLSLQLKYPPTSRVAFPIFRMVRLYKIRWASAPGLAALLADAGRIALKLFDYRVQLAGNFTSSNHSRAEAIHDPPETFLSSGNGRA